MWQFCSVFLIVALIIPSLSPNEMNTINKSITSSFTEKFKQSDYKLEFERIEMVRFNKQFVRRFDIVTYKYNRTTAVVNATWINAIDIQDNMDLIIQAYKFASNEYRMFPIRFSLNFCDAYGKNLIGARTTIKCGNLAGCPILKDVTIKVCKWSPDPSQFPPLIPNGRYMVEFQGLYRSTEMFLGRGYGIVYRPFVKK